MKKFVKILSLCILCFFLSFSLASCSEKKSLYEELVDKGATFSDDTTEKNFMFKELSMKQVKSKLDDNETCFVFFGNINKDLCVKQISIMQKEAEFVNFTGVFYFCSIKNVKSYDDYDKFKVDFGFKLDYTEELIVTCYKNGKYSWYADGHKEKDSASIEAHKFYATNTFSYRAVVDYMNENPDYIKTK